MLQELRIALDHDMPILVKMAAGPPLGIWQQLWKGVAPGAAKGMAPRFDFLKGWAKANPSHGMALGAGAGLLLPRLMSMISNFTNPPG